MQIKVSNIAAVNILSWYNNEDTINNFKKMPLKIQWLIRKNMHAVENSVQSYAEFHNEILQTRNKEWFVEGNGKCKKVVIKKDGKDVETLKILDKYMEEYREYDKKLTEQLDKIAQEENTIEVQELDIDSFIEASDACSASFSADDLEALMLFTEAK